MATSLTATGLRLRPYAGEADLVELARLFNAEAAAQREVVDRRAIAWRKAFS